MIFPSLRNISIKWKLTLIIMTASTVALLLISAAFVTFELLTFRKTMVRDLTTTAEIIGSQSTGALSFDDVSTAEENLRALGANRHIQSACLYKGDKLFAYFPKSTATNSFPQRPQAAGSRFVENSLILFRPIVFNGDRLGTLYLQSDVQEQRDRMLRYASIIVLFMLASSFVTFLLSSLLRRVISQPISHLAETAKAVSSEKNYSVRAVKHGQDELGQLIDVFNEMLTQIQERDAALQQAHDKLEKRVEERTQDLQSEIAERKRAQEALQQQLTRISLLNQITKAISERQDLASILHVVLRQLEDHLTVDMGSVYLFNAESDSLTMAA
ncbi:MAG: putative Histidine kinase, partial [Pedosphaera sp.]|nr:putative Histidine kinase [Pedosphaera sp.]